ncbi:C2H2 type zinc finger domain protein [Metarhizium robertsii ARSEF 23]|nr:C2H2 type zinc finger domain protein [Metarhizium robertsii ARSEF 23]KHO10759.1 C2H2 type zinc finger domain protein [Metarhizium robertsii ARSEF 23]
MVDPADQSTGDKESRSWQTPYKPKQQTSGVRKSQKTAERRFVPDKQANSVIQLGTPQSTAREPPHGLQPPSPGHQNPSPGEWQDARPNAPLQTDSASPSSMDARTWDNLGTTELPEYGPSLSVTASDNVCITTPPDLGDWNDMDVAGLSFLQDVTLRKAPESADMSGNSHYQVGASTHCIFDSSSNECSDTKPDGAPGCSMKTNSCLQELVSHLLR